MEVVPLIIIPNNPLIQFLFPVPVTLSPAGLEILLPNRGIFPPGITTMVPLRLRLRWYLGTLGSSYYREKAGEEGVAVLAGVIGSNCQEEIGLLLHSGDRGDYGDKRIAFLIFCDTS